MKKNNSEILEKVRSSIIKHGELSSKQNNEIDTDSLDDKKLITEKIDKWISINAEKITREIIQQEIKKLFK